MLRVAICDDNKAFLDMLYGMTDEILTEQGAPHQIFPYLSGDLFLEHHDMEPFDAVLLDILMPGPDGFEVARKIRKKSEKTYIIFVTADSDLVYDSFDFRPFYFIPKTPSERLRSRLFYVIQKLLESFSENKSIYLEMAFGEKRYLKPAEIISVCSEANYIDYCLTSGENLRIRCKLGDAENILPSGFFIRVHNRNIVNMAHIRKVDYPNNRIIMDGKQEINISRSYKKKFDIAYTKFISDLS